MAELVAVTIPIYKGVLDADELLSLNQCIDILNAYPLVFFAPAGLDITVYEALCKGKLNCKFEFFEPDYFTGIAGYNRLMLSTAFYKRFFNYKFILIYQLDALVFKDELAYWCSKNYDYIGAPQMPHTNNPNEMQFLKGYSRVLALINKLFKTNLRVSNAGNGGLSLRKTRSCYILLKFLSGKVGKWAYYNEDGFFKYWGNLLRPLFKLADDDTALKFAVEQEPAKSLEKLNGKVPFGCHAFKKYDWQALEPLLKAHNNE